MHLNKNPTEMSKYGTVHFGIILTMYINIKHIPSPTNHSLAFYDYLNKNLESQIFACGF